MARILFLLIYRYKCLGRCRENELKDIPVSIAEVMERYYCKEISGLRTHTFLNIGVKRNRA